MIDGDIKVSKLHRTTLNFVKNADCHNSFRKYLTLFNKIYGWTFSFIWETGVNFTEINTNLLSHQFVAVNSLLGFRRTTYIYEVF